jgi:transposase
LDDHAEVLLALVAEHPDATLDEIGGFLREREIGARRTAIWRFFDRRGISFKKNRARQRAGAGGRGRGAARVAREPALV